MMKTQTLWRSCVLCLLAPFAAQAQETASPDDTISDDTIIVIGGRVPVPQSDLTSAASLIDEDDIELRGGNTLVDTLRSVPGIAVSRSGGVGGLTDIRVRGSEANHTLILIDGIEASVPLTGGYDFAHAPGFGVESVEVLRGEQSALWGSDAIGGVINIRTAGSTGTPSRLLQVEAGDFGTYSASARLSDQRDHLSGGLSASWLSTEGIDVSGLGGEADGYSRFFASTTGRYEFGEDESIQWAARFADFESEFDSDSDFNGLLDDTQDANEGQQSAIGAQLTLNRFGIRHDLAASAAIDQLKSYDAGVFQSETEARRLQAHYQPTVDWQSGDIDHRLTGLIELEREEFESFAGAGAGSNQSREIENTALAVDYRLASGPGRLSASLRQDWNDQFDDSTTWRIGGAWLFDEIGGRVRASVGEGVKNPGVFELYGFFPGSFVGNPDLQPERSLGWEIGWDQEFGDAARVSLTFFESQLEDEIFTDFSGFPFTARNRTTESNRTGVEIEGEATLAPQLTLTGSATFLESNENGQAEVRRPEFLGSLSLLWRSADERFQAGLAADHTGDQLDNEFVTFTQTTLPAYTLVSARIGWQVTDDVLLYVRGTNLTDEEVTDVFGYASEGRGLFVGLRVGR